MRLYALRLRPESAWRTPWQADTLAGMLCGAVAHRHGGNALHERILGPALAGRPPFALSDAFPGDLLPVPMAVKLLDRPADQRKRVKKARWLTTAAFRAAQRGVPPANDDFVAADAVVFATTRLHNTLSRTGPQSGPGGLYPRDEFYLAKKFDHFTVYVRCDESALGLLAEAFRDLAAVGFGADRSAGKGQFALVGGIEPAPGLDAVPAADGVVSLSTFQPGPADPTDGAWGAFVKRGKLGPEFGVDNVFKRPLVVLEPGACFRTPAPRPVLGRTVPMDELLPEDAAAELRGRGVTVAHPAFAVAVPFRFPGGV
jgi:CRISPR-associated protein Csm4